MRMLTEKQAYAAVFKFIEDIYEREENDTIGLLLSEMSLLQDGRTADPAIEADWNLAVDFAMNGGAPKYLILTKSDDKDVSR
jgi:hypothetical protein